MHVTGYPVRHGDFLYFLQGKNLQCTYRFLFPLQFLSRPNIPFHFSCCSSDIIVFVFDDIGQQLNVAERAVFHRSPSSSILLYTLIYIFLYKIQSLSVNIVDKNTLSPINTCFCPSAIYSESIKPLFVLHSGLKLEWQPILTPKEIKKNQKRYYATFQCGAYNI